MLWSFRANRKSLLSLLHLYSESAGLIRATRSSNLSYYVKLLRIDMGKQGLVWRWIARIRRTVGSRLVLRKHNGKRNKKKVTSDIHFYNHRTRPYGFMSNFYQAKVFIDGKTWPTTEHYYQAMKFAGVDDALFKRIRAADSPGKAAGLGRSNKFCSRRDWDEEYVDKHGRVTRVKLEVMRKAVRAKFDQHVYLREKLMATKGRKLVERTAKDRYWGDGGDGSGNNMLGILLMELRDALFQEEEYKSKKTRKTT